MVQQDERQYYKMENIMNKKSQTPQDAIMAIVFLAGIAIAGLLAFYMFGQVFDQIGTTALNNTATINTLEKGRAVNTYWDFIILALFVGFALSVVIIGYFIDVHTIFMPIYIIGLIIGVVIAFIMKYVWEQITAVAPLSTSVLSFPIMNHIIGNLPVYFTIIGALGMIATYAKASPEV